MTDAFLQAVSTAVPGADVHDLFLDLAGTMLAAHPHRHRLFQRMADRSGIAHRFSVLTPADVVASADPLLIARDGFYRRDHFPGTGERMARYEREALPLALDAVRGLPPGSLRGITHVITVSCTGFMAPGLDLLLIEALGLGGAVERTNVGFMGCYAAFNALKLARHAVRSEPHARVLLLDLELCTLHLQPSDDLEQLLSFLLFADGCAAAVIGAEPVGLALDRFDSALIPDTAPHITWRIGDRGFDMFLSGQVPIAISRALAAAPPVPLADPALPPPELWAVHPGGRSVLDAVEHALSLPPDVLLDSRAVLRDHGNMSSATILFVLARILRAAHPPGIPGLAMGFGPGLVAEFLRFRTA